MVKLSHLKVLKIGATFLYECLQSSKILSSIESVSVGRMAIETRTDHQVSVTILYGKYSDLCVEYRLLD
jgi:hypothetical protein